MYNSLFQLNIASYLQLVCLQEGLRTDTHDLLALTELLQGDLRKLLLLLQLWSASGGSTEPLHRPISYLPRCLKDKQMDLHKDTPVKQAPAREPLPSPSPAKIPVPLLKSEDSEDEFQPAARNRRRRICRAIIDDDSSQDSQASQSPRKSSSMLPLVVIPEAGDDSQHSDHVTLSQSSGAVLESQSSLITISCDDSGPAVHAGAFTSLTFGSLRNLEGADILKVSGLYRIYLPVFTITIKV